MIDRVGPFEVLREVGRGGMGVVYLARDTRLDREVAIKALPEHLASDPARLERFEREARTLAGLSHPNVAGIYGVEEQDGARYLILEYVDGETLADRLDRGPLPLDEAIEYAVQIAAGVDAAHEAGVIHRDLKPANIKLTPDGVAKVLDFGLARVEEAGSSTGGLDSPTMTTPQPQHSPTIEGAILGTAAYMSPEQARGRRVDKRTDIWSFGVVLYEMLVGASPFHGETASDSIGAVLHKGFDLGQLPPDTPSNVRRVLQRCLVRDKNLRYRDIGDVRLELVTESKDGSGEAPVAAPRRPGRMLGVVVVVALLAIAGGVFLGRELFTQPPAESRPMSLAIDLEGRYELHQSPQPVFSPDGTRVLLSIEQDGERQVVLRDLAAGTFTEVDISGTGWAYGFSPDGEWCFFDDGDGRLRKQPLDGGPAVTICDTRFTTGGTWAETDEIIFVPGWTEPVSRVNARGGEPEPLYERTEFEGLPPSGYIDAHPRVVPGGRWVIFQRSSSPAWDDTFLMIVPIAGGEPREVMRIAAHPRFLASGHMVFQREDTLMAVTFDAELGLVTSPEVSLPRVLSGSDHWAASPFDLSEAGDLIYIAESGDSAPLELGTLSLAGGWQSLGREIPNNGGVAINDDGTRLVTRVRRDGRSSLSVSELNRGITRPVPGDDERELPGMPVWHPDSATLVFTYRSTGGQWQVGRHRAGAPTTEVMTHSRASFDRLSPREISSDGQTLIAVAWKEADVQGLYAFRMTDSEILTDDPSAIKIVHPENRPGSVRLSPDDRWLAYAERLDGGSEIVVVSMHDPSKMVQASVNGATLMTWAPDADRLYYLNERETPMVMRAVDFSVTEDGDFVPEPPEVLFELEETDRVDWLDMAADGTKFYLSRSVRDASPDAPRLPQVVIGWTELVRNELPSVRMARPRP